MLVSSGIHALNCDQRRIPLAATRRADGSYVLEVPDVDVALPGNYMLFTLGPTDTPSVARIVPRHCPLTGSLSSQ